MEETHTTSTGSADEVTAVQTDVSEVATEAVEVALSEEVLDITPLDEKVTEEGIVSV